jgi:A/G-specific adenine glycosylase
MDLRHRVKPAVSRLLLAWYRAGHRDLPWRRVSDPYRIWVSEVMLQQTRAQAAIPYYQRFIERFPTIGTLASAGEEEVLTLWSGLGYYARARNLLRAARQVVAAGEFPRDYDGIRALPGVGGSTAAAISSMAFGLPCAVLDGNVLRVVARVENDAADIASPRTRERFGAVAQGWLDPRHPGLFNQALMELGATVCLPGKPRCRVCPVCSLCRARVSGTVLELPVKLRKTEPVRIAGALLLVRNGRRILLRQREAGARRMPGFWDLPAPEDLPGARSGARFGEFRHTITHHHYTFTVLAATARRPPGPASPQFRWFRPAALTQIPLSTTARKALKLAGIL